MHIREVSRKFENALRKVGKRVSICIDGRIFDKNAVIQNAGKNYMRRYDDDHLARLATGTGLERNKIMFIPYFKAFDDTENDIVVVWRGKRWLVVADSVMMLRNEPFCIWAMLREISTQKGEYYDDI